MSEFLQAIFKKSKINLKYSNFTYFNRPKRKKPLFKP